MANCNKSSAGWQRRGASSAACCCCLILFESCVWWGGVKDDGAENFSLSRYIIHIQLQLCVCFYVCVQALKSNEKTL